MQVGIGWLIFFKTILCLASISFVSVFNTAGGVNAKNPFDEDGGYVVYEVAWHILRVRVQNVPEVTSLSSTWSAYVFLNNGCIAPDGAYYPEEERGPQCVFNGGAIMKTYELRTRVNITSGHGDGYTNWTSEVLNVVCSGQIEYQDYNLQEVFLGCWAPPEDLQPDPSRFETSAPWIFYLFGAIASFITMVGSWRWWGPWRVKPKRQSRRITLYVPWLECIFYLLASAIVTGQARAAVAWVNAQQSVDVSVAEINSTFLAMTWWLVFFPLVGLGLQFRITRLQHKINTTPPPYVEELDMTSQGVDELPSYDSHHTDATPGLNDMPGPGPAISR